jgi:integrase
MSVQDVQGHQRQQKLKGVISLTEAKQRRMEKLAAITKQIVSGTPEPLNDTFNSIVKRYLKYKSELQPSSRSRLEGILTKHLQPVFGNLMLRSITKPQIQDYVDKRKAECVRADENGKTIITETVRKEFFALRNLMGYTVDQGIIGSNPAIGVKLPRAPEGRVRYEEGNVLHNLLAACPDWLRPIAGICLFTGMRRGEALGMRWRDVDYTRARIRLPFTKNGKERFARINQQALFVLNSLTKGEPDGLVFPPKSYHGNRVNVSMAWRRAAKRAGVKNFRLHDLRHTAASWVKMSGGDLQDVAKLLGHSDVRVAARYAHLSDDHLAAVAGTLDTALADVKVFQLKAPQTVQ